jgi:hypothetical protein
VEVARETCCKLGDLDLTGCSVTPSREKSETTESVAPRPAAMRPLPLSVPISHADIVEMAMLSVATASSMRRSAAGHQ